MKTPELDKKLQEIIRERLADVDQKWLALYAGITLKSVQYQLNPALGREVTYHFVGLLAVNFPQLWELIWKRYIDYCKSGRK